MGNRILAIALIWLGASIAWGILGATVFVRTSMSDENLRQRVGSTWGTAQHQAAPTTTYTVEQTITDPDTKKPARVKTAIPLPIMQTRALVNLNLEQRQKGLLWYNTYTVDFNASYIFHNAGPGRTVQVAFPFPAERAQYDDFRLIVNGRSLSEPHATLFVPSGGDVPVTVRYRSRGLDSWNYDFGELTVGVHDFALRMHTNFSQIDFPAYSISPTDKQQVATGWDFQWNFRNLISGYSIGMSMPEHMQPGPLAQRLALWAPVSLLFFFVILFVISTLRRINIHPMNYLFLAGAFFAFHLLFAYTVDHLSIAVAFIVCSIVSVFLVVSYLRLVVGMRFAAIEAGGAQFVYLILFSFALFYEGWSGLTITIGAIVTLFLLMQITARLDWGMLFARPAKVTE